MPDDMQDKMARAYARLTSLRGNLPENPVIPETYVGEYHAALKHLEDLGFDVEEFKVPQAELKPVFVAGSSVVGDRYTDQRFIQRSYLLAKLDAVLAYFHLKTQEPRREVGFKP